MNVLGYGQMLVKAYLVAKLTGLHEHLDLATQGRDARLPLLPSFVSSLSYSTTARIKISKLASAS